MTVRATDAQIDAAIAKIKRSLSYRRDEKELDYVAVCLIGHPYPVPARIGDNIGRNPIWICTSRTPHTVAKDHDRHNALHPVALFDFVWTTSDRHAKRLKEALDQRILGTDPDLIKLRYAARDMPEWQIVWPILLQDAIADLATGGETIEVFDAQAKVYRVIDHGRRKMAKDAARI